MTSKVKDSSREVKRNLLLLHILSDIKSDLPVVTIRKKHNWSKQRLNNYLSILRAKEYIKLKFRSNFAVYELTERGKRFYIQDMASLQSSIELHNVVWIYELLKEGTLRPDRTWMTPGTTHKMKTFGNVSVIWTHRSLKVHVAHVFGMDAWQTYNVAEIEAGKVVEQLRGMGFVVSSPRLERKPHFGVTDPVIKRVAKGMELRTEDAKVDESEGYGELEYFTPDKADAYIKMPGRLESLENSLGKLIEIQEKKSEVDLQLAHNIELHLQVLNDIKDAIKELRETLRK